MIKKLIFIIFLLRNKKMYDELILNNIITKMWLELYNYLRNGEANLTSIEASRILKDLESEIRSSAEEMYISYRDEDGGKNFIHLVKNNCSPDWYREFLTEIYEQLDSMA